MHTDNFSARTLQPGTAKQFLLEFFGFVKQSESMEPKWAEENLQTIRTLMERSAVYRRALAPIMLLSGGLGLSAAAIGLSVHLNSTTAFGILWLVTAVFAIAGAFLIARRQALRDKEHFWSPPTRRVTQALWPPLLAGLILGFWPMFFSGAWHGLNLGSALVWVMFYGCALHSAGFFIPRGVRLFGLCFMAVDCGVFFAILGGILPENFNAHWLMGFFFGALHLAYGVYLYLTEKKNPVA
jgi:hypothetical protein